MYRSSPLRSALNTGYISGVDMCKVCTEAIQSVVVVVVVVVVAVVVVVVVVAVVVVVEVLFFTGPKARVWALTGPKFAFVIKKSIGTRSWVETEFFY